MTKNYDLICTGMALVDSIIKGFNPKPISAAGYRAASGDLHIGGEAVNEALAASKLGMRTAILCTLGNDTAGDMVEAGLKAWGIDTDLIAKHADHSTPVTTMLVNDDGTRMSITNRSHKFNFHPERYTDCFTQTKAITLGSLFRAPYDDSKIIHDVLTAATENGVMIFADTKIPNFRALTLSDIADSLPLIDYITPNEDEGKYYTGKETPEEMADVFLSFGVKNVIIKLGSKGCYLKNSEHEIKLPAFAIDAVDSTGAGDNFIAAFASELIRGSNVENALLFASACGAICTTAIGAGTGLKDRQQVEAFLETHRKDMI